MSMLLFLARFARSSNSNSLTAKGRSSSKSENPQSGIAVFGWKIEFPHRHILVLTLTSRPFAKHVDSFNAFGGRKIRSCKFSMMLHEIFTSLTQNKPPDQPAGK